MFQFMVQDLSIKTFKKKAVSTLCSVTVNSNGEYPLAGYFSFLIMARWK